MVICYHNAISLCLMVRDMATGRSCHSLDHGFEVLTPGLASGDQIQVFHLDYHLSSCSGLVPQPRWPSILPSDWLR